MRERRPIGLLGIAFIVLSLSVPSASTAEGSVTPVRGSILFSGGPGLAVGRYPVYAVDAGGGRLKELITDASEAHWSPDGTRLAFVRRAPSSDVPTETAKTGLYVVRADGTGARRLTWLQAPGIPQFSWSPDGRRIAYLDLTERGEVIVAIGVNGRDKVKLAEGASPRWSPDGTRIAFTRHGALFVVRANGTAERQIAPNAFSLSPQSWSPDGTRIAFYPCCNEGFAIVDVNTARQRSFGDGVLTPSWSPDGKWIALGSGGGTSLIRPDGRGLHQVSLLGGTADAAWSPDSRAVAVLDSVFTSDVWVVPIDGRRPRRLTQGWRYGYGNYEPEWQPKALPTAKLGGRYVSRATPTDSVPDGDVLRATHTVERIAADGPRVAIAYLSNPPPSGGGHIELWRPGGAVTPFYPSCCASGGLALADERAAWSDYTTAQSRDNWRLTTATAPVPRAVPVPTGSKVFYEPVTDLVGDDSLLVYTMWGPCPLSRADPCARQPKRNGRLYRLDGTRLVELASSTGALTPLSVDAGRILVDHEDGTLELLAADGTKLRTFRLNPALARGARLQGRDLVVLTPTAVEITDAETGTFLRRWPVSAAGARLEDVQDGIAVLVAGTTVHLLRLTDGRNAVIEAPGAGPVLAQLEPSGLFYSYRADDARYPGRVVFVPFDRLPQA